MTSDDLDKSSPVLALGVVLAVHCSTPLVHLCVDATARVGMSTRECDLITMAKQVAERRPRALLVPSYLYEFDPFEFESVARIAGARLLIVDEEIRQEALERVIDRLAAPLLKAHFAALSRYSVVGGCAIEDTQPRRASQQRFEAVAGGRSRAG